MGFVRQKRIYINDVDEFNKLLKIAKEDRIPFMREPDPSENIRCSAFINDKLTCTELTMVINSACTYIFNKDCRKDEQQISGLDAYNQIAKAFSTATGYKIPKYINEFGSASAILGYRPGVADHQRVLAYSYDANSAYGWGLKQPMPDTREMVGAYDIVREGQIGFTFDEEDKIPGFQTTESVGLKMVREGGMAEYIFNLMDSPFKKFADTWYERKANPKNPEEKAKAKQMICYSVGYLQRVNPFLRAAVVEYTNEYIRNLIDDNTIYINTDCIISTKPRIDIPIGTKMGEFKQDHTGLFAHDGFNYQWDLELPTYRGVPKSWFDAGWDILKDPLPGNKNVYELNPVNLQMEAHKWQTQLLN